jgi:tRNA threonylcarbamoyl adenosine modification protein YeaZ
MILLIDCSKGLNLILGNKKKIIQTLNKPRIKKVSEALVTETEILLNSASKSYKDLTKIIVINGPGSFTGVRTGVTVAKVLALSLNIPVCGISQFELLSMEYSKIQSNKDQKIYIHLNDHKFFFQSILKSGKKSEIRVVNFETDIPADILRYDVISNDNKIVNSLKIISKLNQKLNICIYRDIFSLCYNNLVNLAENKYIPNPIYVKTF